MPIVRIEPDSNASQQYVAPRRRVRVGVRVEAERRVDVIVTNREGLDAFLVGQANVPSYVWAKDVTSFEEAFVPDPGTSWWLIVVNWNAVEVAAFVEASW